ncbi:hypothetical protein SAMN04488136_1644 [Vibrio xiamenensis]|uniref:Uncharacterized protein n=1 Tax=Vibrio xiamenensis TaxID=861298 RepID=A0A1G8HUQ6_9VIBR|nr:hypothetical protein [Vibrio xiamenensis]SDI10210.1 hypothetical protein SAMN04488136_1644 [Vibrio xiamenensis]
MSTAETAALIESVNELTNTVAGKVQEIDAKVDEATNVTPVTIKNWMHRIYYVNAETGSDDNDGQTIATAKKTIAGAVSDSSSGSFIYVRLLGAKIYDLASVVDLTNRTVYVSSYGATWGDASTRSTIRGALRSADYYWSGQFKLGWNGRIHFEQVNFETVTFSESKASYDDYRCSLISGSSSSGQVWFYGCSANLNNGPLVHQHSGGSFGMLDIYLNNVSLTKNDNLLIADGNPVLVGDYGNAPLPFTLFANSVALPTDETWSSMVTCNISQIISNVSFE